MNLAAKAFENEENHLKESSIDYFIRGRLFGILGKKIIVTGYNTHGRWELVHDYITGDIINGENGEGELILTKKDNPNLKK